MPGRTKGTWPKGKKPPVSKPKGAKSKKTLLKERLGLKNWSELQLFIETKGIARAVKEMEKLKGKEYMTAFTSLTEFVKPKLARTEILADVKTDITWNETKTYDGADKKTNNSPGPARRQKNK